MTFMLRFAELPTYLRIAYIFSVLLIICHFLAIASLLYWQIYEPDNLTFKAWFKAPLHLDFFDTVKTAVGVGFVFLVLQLVGLYMFISWIFQQGRKCYYLMFALLIIGIWTYFLLPALIIIGLMLPEVSLHHFGLLSFEDLF